MLKHIIFALGALSTLLLTACQTYEPRETGARSSSHAYHAQRIRSDRGEVSSIEVIQGNARPTGGGAVLGAVLGGVLGNQVGKGRGRAAATGAGVIGGALLGNQLEQQNDHSNQIYRVTVTFENGHQGQFDYQDIGDLRVGDFVQLQDGQLIRR